MRSDFSLNNHKYVFGKIQEHNKYVHLPQIVDNLPINGEPTGRGWRLSVVVIRIESGWAESYFAVVTHICLFK